MNVIFCLLPPSKKKKTAPMSIANGELLISKVVEIVVVCDCVVVC